MLTRTSADDEIARHASRAVRCDTEGRILHSHSWDMDRIPQIQNGSLDVFTPLSGTVCSLYAGTSYTCTSGLCTKFEISTLTHSIDTKGDSGTSGSRRRPVGEFPLTGKPVPWIPCVREAVIPGWTVVSRRREHAEPCRRSSRHHGPCTCHGNSHRGPSHRAAAVATVLHPPYTYTPQTIPV